MASRLVTCRNMTLAQFADGLNGALYGFPPITDETGIKGRYDLTIDFPRPAAVRALGIPAMRGDLVALEPDGNFHLRSGQQTTRPQAPATEGEGGGSGCRPCKRDADGELTEALKISQNGITVKSGTF